MRCFRAGIRGSEASSGRVAQGADTVNLVGWESVGKAALCTLSALCDSVVSAFIGNLHHRGIEDTEYTQSPFFFRQTRALKIGAFSKGRHRGVHNSPKSLER